jgi:hypothetical protein
MQHLAQEDVRVAAGAALEKEVEREGVGRGARAAHSPVEEDGVFGARGGAEAGAEGGVEEEGGAGHSVEQAERVAEVERVGRMNAVGEGVEEVRGGGLVEETAGSCEEGVELGGLPDGARGRPWRRWHVTTEEGSSCFCFGWLLWQWSYWIGVCGAPDAPQSWLAFRNFKKNEEENYSFFYAPICFSLLDHSETTKKMCKMATKM